LPPRPSGVEQQTLDMALQRLTCRVAEAANGTGEAKDALAQMGIALRDQSGNLRRSEDLLGDVADAFARIEDPAERVRLAFNRDSPDTSSRRPTMRRSNAVGKIAMVGTWPQRAPRLRKTALSGLRPALGSRLSGSRAIMDAPRRSGCCRSWLAMLKPGTAAAVV
jgi:hypothetical protein